MLGWSTCPSSSQGFSRRISLFSTKSPQEAIVLWIYFSWYRFDRNHIFKTRNNQWKQPFQNTRFFGSSPFRIRNKPCTDTRFFLNLSPLPNTITIIPWLYVGMLQYFLFQNFWPFMAFHFHHNKKFPIWFYENIFGPVQEILP